MLKATNESTYAHTVTVAANKQSATVAFTTASTSDNAFSISDPNSYSIWSTAKFSEEVDDTFLTPDKGLISGTKGCTMFLSTSSADAPDQKTDITINSMLRSGNNCLLTLWTDSKPVIIKGRAEKRNVNVIFKEPGKVYIRGTLKSGDKVITSRLATLGDGVKVKIIKWPTFPY